MIKYNVNHQIRVQLTDKGRAVLKKAHYAKYAHMMDDENKHLFKYSKPKEDKEGWSNWQMWQFMEEMGPHINISSYGLFSTEIELLNVPSDDVFNRDREIKQIKDYVEKDRESPRVKYPAYNDDRENSPDVNKGQDDGRK